MHRCKRTFQSFSFVSVFAFSSLAFAQEMPDTAAAAAGEPGAAPMDVSPEAGTVAAPAAVKDLNAAQYGVAFRARWVSVPSWFLGLFAQKNVPLSSYSVGLEGYRRKRDRDDPNRTWELSVGIGFQDMSMPDGYWLGKGKDASVDTDLVQAKNFGLITMDAAFVSRQYFSRYFGIHYGAGLGLAVVRGKILRTSARQDGKGGFIVQADGGPVLCDASAKCNETALGRTTTSGGHDQWNDPHRFEETSVPGAIPIINLLFGLDFPIPDAKGLEFRLEGGFFDAFFLGGAAGYVF
jgi:hypothetical protein